MTRESRRRFREDSRRSKRQLRRLATNSDIHRTHHSDEDRNQFEDNLANSFKMKHKLRVHERYNFSVISFVTKGMTYLLDSTRRLTTPTHHGSQMFTHRAKAAAHTYHRLATPLYFLRMLDIEGTFHIDPVFIGSENCLDMHKNSLSLT